MEAEERPVKWCVYGTFTSKRVRKLKNTKFRTLVKMVVSPQICPSVWSWRMATIMGEFIHSCCIHPFFPLMHLSLHLFRFLFFNLGGIRKVRRSVTWHAFVLITHLNDTDAPLFFRGRRGAGRRRWDSTAQPRSKQSQQPVGERFPWLPHKQRCWVRLISSSMLESLTVNHRLLHRFFLLVTRFSALPF